MTAESKSVECTTGSPRPRRPSRLDAQRHDFHTKTAMALTGVTLLALALLSIVFSSPSSPSSPVASRWLQEDNNNDDDNDQQGDYSGFSCRRIFEETANAGQAQCDFARTCNQGDGVWAPFVFCSSFMSANFLAALLSPIMILWMVLLFRMLGSTAEDFFSPSLEMFSVKLGLPPRFAGVSLLALGNGAADVSATVSAIKSDPQNGYKFALGALSGAAMVIGGVVSALVVLVNEGVPCRGALVRDVTALLVTVLVVWKQFASGMVGPESVTLFLSLYVIFVILVLVADVYHRAVVLPRRALVEQEEERQRQLEEQRLHEAALSPEIDMVENHQPRMQSRLANVITALSNYDNDNNNQDGWGIESDVIASERPVMLHGTHGILNGDGLHGHPTPDGDQADYSMLGDAVDHMCVDPQSAGIPSSNWSGAFYDGQQELQEHANQVWDDIVWNGDLSIVTKFLLILELPFMTLRKLTVPIPCEGYYVRALVALSLALSPLWFAYYLWEGHEINVWTNGGWKIFLPIWLVIMLCAVVILRYAPGGEGDMKLIFATPVALYGFAIAATWIDTIADSLVSLLDFIGIVLRIPGPIVGLTILAWGNSMGDLSANITMARKGLANMAMTACFAGPVFNILMGLGLGLGLGNAEKEVELPPSVETGFLFILLNSTVILLTGLCWGKGRIPKRFGYISLSLYLIYVVFAITLQYSKFGNNDEEQ